ncbi:MAG TPA: 7-cyano-7-deazaguanine synthase [Patescibacteria group bacterium]|nr:7-cyano-7-deazaguanine synthase [Patescibacteria group bacterium]
MDTFGNRVAILVSGGIDSTVLLYRLINEGYEVTPVYINYGQNSQCGELSAIKSIMDSCLFEKLVEIDFPEARKLGKGSLVGEYPSEVGKTEHWFQAEFFPNRNMILISLAAAYCYKIGISTIAIGVVGKQSYSDTTKAFIEAMNAALSISLGNFSIIAPYVEKSRTIVVKDAVKYNVPVEKTFSCNSVGDRHCNYCISCFERERVIKRVHLLRKKR